MITVTTEFEVQNVPQFSLIVLSRISCNEPGKINNIDNWLSTHETCDGNGKSTTTFSINHTGAPLLFDNKYDPDALCEALSHHIRRGFRMSLYIIEDDGSIETHYISNGMHYQV